MLQAFGKLCVGGGRPRLVEHVERARRHGGRVGPRNQSAGEIRAGNAAKQREAVDGRRDANVAAPAGLIRQDPTSTDAPVEPAVPQICVAVPLVALQISAKDLVAKIQIFVKAYNAKATPFVWTATSEQILDKVERICKSICGTRD